jgi:hypothetical protein
LAAAIAVTDAWAWPLSSAYREGSIAHLPLNGARKRLTLLFAS